MIPLILLALLVPVGLSAAVPISRPELIDRIVAVIDDNVILWSELNYRLRMELEERGSAAYLDPTALAEQRRLVLDQMVDEQVLVLKAQKDSVEVDPSEVEELLNEQFRMLRSSMPEAEFQQMLERIHITERQLKARYRRDIRHRLLYRQMRNQVAFKMHITRRDLDAFRAAWSDSLPPQVSISHINLRLRPSPEVLAAKRERILELQARLQAGEPFADVATQYSEDRGSAGQGGDLGCFESGQLVPEFEEAAFKLQPGEVSEPVLTKYGYHLIKLREKREDGLCASHILVMAQPTEEDRRRVLTELRELRQRALAGEDFAELARQHSQNLQTGVRGGLWDVFPRDRVPVFLQPHLRGLRLGQISEPFFLDDGAHVIKVNDDQATLESLIREQRTAQTMDQMIEDYKHQIHLEKRLDDDFLRPPGYDTSGRLPEERGPVQAAH